MRGRHADEPRRGNPLELLHPQPLLVGRHVHELGARRGEAEGEARVVRLLEHRDVARVDEQARAEVDCLLRALHDQDLLGLAGHAARARQVAGERLAQLGGAARRLVGEAPHREAPRATAEETRPGGEREIGVGGLAVAEVVADVLARQAPAHAARGQLARDAPPDRREPRRVAPPRARRLARAARQRLRDEGARALARAGVALRHELLEGLEHGVARDPELLAPGCATRRGAFRPAAGPRGWRRGGPGRSAGGAGLRRRGGARARPGSGTTVLPECGSFRVPGTGRSSPP